MVFPECALSGYGFSSREEGLAHAVPLDSAPVRTVVAACAPPSVLLHLRLAGARRLADCSTPVCWPVPRASSGRYRKVHLPFLGIDMFVDPGDRPFAVHDAGGLKVGMHICYDGSFPETARVLSAAGR